MYSDMIKKIDIIICIAAAASVIALWLNTHAFIESIIIIIATVTLVASKSVFNRTLIFVAYAFSSLLLGLLFSMLAETITFNSFMLPSNYLSVVLLALLIGLIAAYARLESSILSVVWFTLYVLMIIASAMLKDISFLHAFWSKDAQLYMMQKFYPFLLASMLIGVFMEKYQIAMKRDRRSD
ncbi:hypothetical protein [Bacillus testis]|uniref:hypothetical protein n=1 Tax=Bacillus testis TaxID=1622072 RepID=UPI00067EF04A|nr:hypothetical protein [Bacillus testis]